MRRRNTHGRPHAWRRSASSSRSTGSRTSASSGRPNPSFEASAVKRGTFRPASDILALSTEDLLRRRFEWIVFTKGLSLTTRGGRQLIVHGHLSIKDHRVTRPGYLVLAEEERTIDYSPTSPVHSEDHPMRIALRERLQAKGEAPAPVPAEGGA
jgi:ribosomal protein S4